MTQRPPTYSPAHLRRQRESHAKADGYGRHRHLYLHDTMRRLAKQLGETYPPAELSWLDYGCGKGGFIEQVRPLGLFTTIAGYDPAVHAFQAPPTGQYDIVTCLHVLDVIEPNFLDAVLTDIAGYTRHLALFDILTLPKQVGGLRPHKPFYWTQLIRRQMAIVETTVEYPGMQDFERAIVVAAPRK